MAISRVCIAIIAIFFLALPMPAIAEVTWISRAQSKRVIVFVHGLWGDPKTTFLADGASASWPELMAKDNTPFRGVKLSSYSVAVVGLPTGRGERVSLSQVSTLFKGFLNDYGLVDEYEDIVFISHSLGGLVVKQMLLEEVTEKKEVILKKVSGIFLFSVPSQGAPAAEFVAKLPSILPGRLVADLKTIDVNTYLNNLENSWRSFVQAQPHPRTFKILCAFETEPVGSIVGVTVVPEQYTATICDNRPQPTVENHISIVKPATMNAPVYIWTKARFAELRAVTALGPELPRYRDAAGQTVPAPPATKDNLPGQPSDRSRKGLGSGFNINRSAGLYFMDEDVPPTAASKARSDGSVADLSVLDFVSQFLAIWTKGKAEDIRYSDRVDYYNEGYKSKGEAIKESSRVFVDCPTRSYVVSETGNVSIRPKSSQPGVINAIVPVRYRLDCKTKTLAGTGKFDLDLRREGHSFKITGVNLVDRRDSVIRRK